MNRILFFDMMIVADKIGARGTRNDMECKQKWKKMTFHFHSFFKVVYISHLTIENLWHNLLFLPPWSLYYSYRYILDNVIFFRPISAHQHA